jgi:hypothetical protein
VEAARKSGFLLRVNWNQEESGMWNRRWLLAVLMTLSVGAVGCAADVGSEGEEGGDYISIEEAVESGLLPESALEEHVESDYSGSESSFYASCNVTNFREPYRYFKRAEREIGRRAYANGYGSGCAAGCYEWARALRFPSWSVSVHTRSSDGLVICVLEQPLVFQAPHDWGTGSPVLSDIVD